MSKAQAKPKAQPKPPAPSHPLDAAVTRLCELMEDYPHDWDSKAELVYAQGAFYSSILFRGEHVLTRRRFYGRDPFSSDMWDALRGGPDLTFEHSARLSDAWAKAELVRDRASNRARARANKLACEAFEASVYALIEPKRRAGEIVSIEPPKATRPWWRFWR